MKVLVTGATGFIGSHLCSALALAGHAVRALHRPASNLLLLQDTPVERVVGDVTDPPSLEVAMTGVEALFHCAGIVSGWRDARRMTASHVAGTRNVLRAALKCGVDRMVHTSSVAALGVPEREPKSAGETIPLMHEAHRWNSEPKLWPYGYAKHRAELEVAEALRAGLEVVIVNPSAVFGAGDLNLIAGRLIWLMARGRIIPINPPGGLNAVHIGDVTAGHLAALEKGRSGERYILGGENLTHVRLIALTAEVAGRSPPTRTAPAWLLRRLAGLADPFTQLLNLPVQGHMLRLAGKFFYYDNRKARTELLLPEPRPYRVAAEEAFAWYQNHPELQ